jgi:nicotinamidase-related amidase
LTDLDENSTARAVVGRLEPPDLTRTRPALVVIDLQELDASPSGAHAQQARELGRWAEIEPYFARVGEVVVPNVGRLAGAVRDRGGAVIYVRCRSLTPDARDNGRRFREFGIAVGSDDPGAALLDGLDVRPEDIVLDKTTASPFWSTQLEHLLRQLGTECLIVAGVVTSGCIESTVRDACDLDYQVVLVEDACADRRPALHEDAIRRLNNNFAVARSTDEVLDGLLGTSASERSGRAG